MSAPVPLEFNLPAAKGAAEPLQAALVDSLAPNTRRASRYTRIESVGEALQYL